MRRGKPSTWIYISFLLALLLCAPLYYGSPIYAERETRQAVRNRPAVEAPAVDDGFVGELKITHYTPDPAENGGYTDRNGNALTATGNIVVPGVTAAVQKGGEIPMGATILIVGVGTRLVDDCGVGANHIDLAVGDKETAFELGVQYRDVYIIKSGYVENESKEVK